MGGKGRTSFMQVMVLVAVVATCLFSGKTALATVYDVGDGKPYTSIGAVPWESLAAGDTVNIYYRATAYRSSWSARWGRCHSR